MGDESRGRRRDAAAAAPPPPPRRRGSSIETGVGTESDDDDDDDRGAPWALAVPGGEPVVVRASDEAAAVARGVWALAKRAVGQAPAGEDALRREDRREARRACLLAHNAATPVARARVWDAPTPSKFDAKAEKWTLPAADGGERDDGRPPKSPPTILAPDPGPRCAWTSRKAVRRSRFLALHRRRVAERSLRAEEVLETVVDAGGSRWTLSLDARRPEKAPPPAPNGAAAWDDDDDDEARAAGGRGARNPDRARSCDDASDLGVYARCDFAGPSGARPFGACCEARFAFCVVENLAEPGAASAGARLAGCAGSRAASWLFRGRELYEDQSVPPLPARGFARLVLGLGGDEEDDEEPADAAARRAAAAAGPGGGLWFWRATSDDLPDDDDDDPELVVTASVLVSRRAKGADTWRLVRRCCAERASGYSPATLRPQNLWAFLCRAIRWGDVRSAARGVSRPFANARRIAAGARRWDIRPTDGRGRTAADYTERKHSLGGVGPRS